MSDSKHLILSERSSDPLELETELSKVELELIEAIRTRYGKNAIEVVLSHAGRHALKSNQYVGMIPLQGRIVKIIPKIPKISLISMTRYALDLPQIMLSEQFLAQDNNDYLDIVALMLLTEVEEILRKIPIHGFVAKEEDLHYIRGKILFKHQILRNNGRHDRIFCKYSDLSQDVLENRIIKASLHALRDYPFVDARMNNWIEEQLQYCDKISLVRISDHAFRSINFTPLNEHYRNALSMCQLVLENQSITQLGEGFSSLPPFLINMDSLFQDFVAQIILISLGQENVSVRPTEFADLASVRLKIYPDIELFVQGTQQMILDTKYKEPTSEPSRDDLSQMVLYSNSTGIKKCVLVYPTKLEKKRFDLKNGITLYCIGFDTSASNLEEFEEKCRQFVAELRAV